MGGAEGELRHQESEREGQEVGAEPACGDQEQAALGVHDEGVVQRKADGHIAVICHDSQQEVIQQSQCHKEIHLQETPGIGDGVMLCLEVHQHLGDDGAGEAGVNEGQVGQEEVHRGVEVVVRANGQDDEQVAHHGDQVHGQEEPKEERLLFRVLREAEEQEVGDGSEVWSFLGRESNYRGTLLQGNEV